MMPLITNELCFHSRTNSNRRRGDTPYFVPNRDHVQFDFVCHSASRCAGVRQDGSGGSDGADEDGSDEPDEDAKLPAIPAADAKLPADADAAAAADAARQLPADADAVSLWSEHGDHQLAVLEQPGLVGGELFG